MPHSESAILDLAVQALDSFRIEIPSWGFANTGTRFGKFAQAAAASTVEEKFADAAEVNRLTGVTPTIALHVLWDLPNGIDDVPEIQELERRYGAAQQAEEQATQQIASPVSRMISVRYRSMSPACHRTTFWHGALAERLTFARASP